MFPVTNPDFSQQQFQVPDVPLLAFGTQMDLVTPDAYGKVRYEEWSIRMRDFLTSQGLWDIIGASLKPKNTIDDYQTWRKNNAAALYAIQSSCEPTLRYYIQGITSAKIAWDTLARMHQQEAEGRNPFELSTGPVYMGDLSKLKRQPVPRVCPGLPGILWYFDLDNHRFGPLHAAINYGDWDAVKSFIERDPDALTEKISQYGLLPIHCAAMAGQERVTEGLVGLMNEKDLEIQASAGDTALAHAAHGGWTRIVKCMLQKNKKLIHIPNMRGIIPVAGACMGGHRETTMYLYAKTPIDLLYPENGPHGATLLVHAIYSGMFDVALDLLRRCPRLTISASNNGSIPLVVLSMTASAFPSACNLPFWKQWIYSLFHVKPPSATSDLRASDSPQNQENNIMGRVISQQEGLPSRLLKFLGIKQIYKMKKTHVLALELLRQMGRAISALGHGELPVDLVGNAITEAVKNGTVEFVVEMVKASPDHIYYTDSYGRDIIGTAIACRQENIYNLVYALDARISLSVDRWDNFGYSALHLAGLLAPPNQLARISGAALQMQRELQWFQEVETVVQPITKELKNMYNETPQQVFTREHNKLVKEGEEWMKGTANSCTVVGALIITIMFTAVFTVPGGNHQDTGYPIFINEKFFKVFIIADAVSLFASSTSVLMFLGILTSRYAEEDFLKSLPKKLVIGLSTLFFSIAAMMLAFCAALVIMLDGRLRLIIPIALLSSIPVTLFIMLQFPLLVEFFVSTYGSGIFNRKMERWY